MANQQTTIRVSKNLLETLRERKVYPKESYEELIWDLLENSMELSEQTLKDLKEAENDIKRGRIISYEEVKRKLKIG